MCGRSDVIQALNRRSMVSYSCERAPQKELVGRARSAIGIAPDQVNIGSFQIGGRERHAFLYRALQIWNLPRQFSNHTVGVALAQRLGPGAITRVQLSCGISLGTAGKFLQLQPENPPPSGRTRWIYRQRL